MENSVRALIKIDDETIQFSSLTLSQSTGGHHTFSIRVLYSQITTGMIQEKADAYLGKKCSIFLGPMEDRALLERSAEEDPFFQGIITEVELLRDDPGKGYLVIQGGSPTISLETGPHTRSFTDKSLKEIVDQVLSETGCRTPLTLGDELPAPSIEPMYGDTLPYVVQYRESNFQFINRLASQFGEWLYYDNEKLIFGERESDPDSALTLYMGEDLPDFSLEVKALPAQFKWQSYDYLKHDYPENEPALTAEGDLFKTAYKVSKETIFQQIPFSPTGTGLDEKELKFEAETRLKADSSRMVTLSGTSLNPALKPGVVFTIIDRQRLEEEDYGAYVITEVHHGLSSDGNYRNSFQAIPEDAPAPPPPADLELPVCEPQLAEVVEVNDEESLGRVRVQFSWQKVGEGNEISPWIRVSTPYSGGDKGVYIIPEIGDQVLIHFESGNPARPYVVGGFYHARAKPSFFDPENKQKAVIQTRAGNKILIDDTGGSEKITIANPSKNTVTIDASGPSISISSSGGKISISSDEISLDAKNIKLNGSENIEINAGKDMIMKGNNVTTEASVKYDLKGTKVTVEGSATCDIKSAIINVQASGITSVTGSMIKLNS